MRSYCPLTWDPEDDLSRKLKSNKVCADYVCMIQICNTCHLNFVFNLNHNHGCGDRNGDSLLLLGHFEYSDKNLTVSHHSTKSFYHKNNNKHNCNLPKQKYICFENRVKKYENYTIILSQSFFIIFHDLFQIKVTLHSFLKVIN